MKKPDKLMTDVISVATACCTEHSTRIKGLGINILVRLFQIMIIQFSEKTIVQLLQLLFSPEGFKKHISNFAMHLVELKVFMKMHLPKSIIFKIEEFENFKNEPIAKYNIKWITDKVNKIDNKSQTKGFLNMLKKGIISYNGVNCEAEIWLKLIKPTFNR